VSAWPIILFAVSLDSMGKKLGDRQRDAVLAESGPGEHLARAVGFRQSMSALGAILGPLLAYFLLQLTPGDLRLLLLATAVPAMFAVLLSLILYRGYAKGSLSGLRSLLSFQNPKSKIQNPKLLGLRFWMYTGASTVFALGNISVAFMVLRGAGLEKAALLVPLMYLAYKLTQILLGRPLRALSERWGRLPMLISAQVVIILIYAGWAGASLALHSWVLFVAYGVYTAAIADTSTGFAADIVPHEVREQALGWFSVFTGVGVIVGNIIAGGLWSLAGPGAAFTYGAWAVALALTLSIAWLPWLLGTQYLTQTGEAV
jgi:MFS family permease